MYRDLGDSLRTTGDFVYNSAVIPIWWNFRTMTSINTLSLSDFRKHCSSLIRTLRHNSSRTVCVSIRGEKVAVLISQKEFEEYRKLKIREEFRSIFDELDDFNRAMVNKWFNTSSLFVMMQLKAMAACSDVSIRKTLVDVIIHVATGKMSVEALAPNLSYSLSDNRAKVVIQKDGNEENVSMFRIFAFNKFYKNSCFR